MRAPKFFTLLSVAFFSATRPIATSIIPPLAASLMKALSAELNVPPLALLLLISDFDLPVLSPDEPELLGLAVGNILGFCATAVPLKPMQPVAITLRTNRIFIESLFFIGFDKIRAPKQKFGTPVSRRADEMVVRLAVCASLATSHVRTFHSRRYVFVAVVRLVNLLHAAK